MAFQRRKSMDDTPAKGGRGERAPSIRDLVGMVEWPKKAKFLTGRMHPGVVPVGVHKYPLFRKDGSPVISERSKKQTEVDKVCLAFDPETSEIDPDKSCPYCDAELYFKIDYYAEFLVREEVENEPAKHKPTKEETKTGFKDLDNDNSWTPNRVFRFTANSFKRLKALKQLNKVMVDGEKQPMAIDDEEYGCDVNMNFDPDATGDGMYGLQRSDQCALTEEEQAYLHWDIESAVEKATESEDEAQRNVDWYNKHAGAAEEGGEDYEPEEGDQVTITDEDDDEYTGTVTEIDDKKVVIEDEDGDEHTFRRSKIESIKPVATKKKPAGKAKSKAKDDDDEDDEDDKPSAKSKSKAAPAKSKAKAKPEPEEEEEEEEESSDYEPEEGDRVTITDEDGDEHVGEVTDLNAKKKSITITDDDGDELTFKLADVTVEAAPAPKAKSKAKAKAEPEEEEEEDDDYEPEEGDEVIILDGDDEEQARGKVTDLDAKTIEVTDEDGDEHTFKLAKVTVKKAPAKAKAKAKSKTAPAKSKAKADDDDEDEDDKPAAKKKAGGKPARSFDFDED